MIITADSTALLHKILGCIFCSFFLKFLFKHLQFCFFLFFYLRDLCDCADGLFWKHTLHSNRGNLVSKVLCRVLCSTGCVITLILTTGITT